MDTTVNLGRDLINMALSYSGAEDRSVTQQIEHWAKIGRIAEENPDLSYSVIKEILLGLEDVKFDNLQEYDPDKL